MTVKGSEFGGFELMSSDGKVIVHSSHPQPLKQVKSAYERLRDVLEAKDAADAADAYDLYLAEVASGEGMREEMGEE